MADLGAGDYTYALPICMSTTVVPLRLTLLDIPAWFPAMPGVCGPGLDPPTVIAENSAEGRDIDVGLMETEPAFRRSEDMVRGAVPRVVTEEEMS